MSPKHDNKEVNGGIEAKCIKKVATLRAVPTKEKPSPRLVDRFGRQNYAVKGQYVTNNTIRGNTLANNQYVIEIDYTRNIFYHNNFKNNTFHVFFPFVYTPHNAWDNEVEGNWAEVP